jgi:hypothetical protein
MNSTGMTTDITDCADKEKSSSAIRAIRAVRSLTINYWRTKLSYRLVPPLTANSLNSQR